MILHQKNRITDHTHSEVFPPDDDDEVRKYHKLFKNLMAPLGVRAIRDMFEAECEAFERVLDCSDIAHYVPDFNRVVVERVVDAEGRDVSDDYLLDCCYSTGAVKGCETGAVAIKEYPWGRTLMARLKELEINYWEDGDVFLNDDRSSGVLIDIATEDVRRLLCYRDVFT